jgi:hypothetical protein
MLGVIFRYKFQYSRALYIYILLRLWLMILHLYQL